MTSPGEMAIDHQMAAEDDKDTRERMPDPAGPLPTENPQPVAPATAWRPGATVMASPADESKVAGHQTHVRTGVVMEAVQEVDEEPGGLLLYFAGAVIAMSCSPGCPRASAHTGEPARTPASMRGTCA